MRGFREPTYKTKSLGSTAFSFHNIDAFTATTLLKTLVRDRYLITDAFNKTVDMFGDGAVVEIRDYQISEGGIGQKLHVLDVDKESNLAEEGE